MKRKNLVKLFTILIVLSIIVFLLFYFSRNIYKINLFENIKNAFVNQISDSNYENDVTVVDVTGLIIGQETEHEHTYKTMYDSQKHWQECTICGQKNNEISHSYTSQWTMGSANNCHTSNVNKFTCSCGYFYENSVGRKSHSKTERIYNNGWFSVYDRCTSCFCQFNQHDCYKSNGTRIKCNNIGVCRTCGYNWSNNWLHEAYLYVRNRK